MVDLTEGQFADELEFHKDSVWPDSRVGDHVAVTFFGGVGVPTRHETYLLVEYDVVTEIFKAKHVNYPKLARAAIRRQRFF